MTATSTQTRPTPAMMPKKKTVLTARPPAPITPADEQTVTS